MPFPRRIPKPREHTNNRFLWAATGVTCAWAVMGYILVDKYDWLKPKRIRRYLKADPNDPEIIAMMAAREAEVTKNRMLLKEGRIFHSNRPEATEHMHQEAQKTMLSNEKLKKYFVMPEFLENLDKIRLPGDAPISITSSSQFKGAEGGDGGQGGGSGQAAKNSTEQIAAQDK